MFKLLALKLRKHPLLGDLEVEFVNDGEKNNGPYTTLIIGANGTGKSNILRSIIDIFRSLENLKFRDEQRLLIRCPFSIKYEYEGSTYTYTTHTKSLHSGSSDKIQKDDKSIKISDLPLPSKLLASSIMLNDKFLAQQKNSPKSMYKYMGARRTAEAAGTKTLIRRVVLDITKVLDKKGFHDNLSDTLRFLNLDPQLSVTYTPLYRKQFFSGHLTLKELEDFFEDWKKTGRRKTAPWGLSHYKNIKNRKDLMHDLVSFINEASKRLKKTGSRAEVLEYDIMNSKDLQRDYSFISHLNSLDLLRAPNIRIGNKDKYNIEESSSGEYHFLITVVGLIANIQENSLVLIDEPEISFHPNWQMKYIEALKSIFHRYKSCHFLIATHSHYLVSDLKGDTSAIVSLHRDEKITAELFDVNTYGWSAESVLYNIFEVITTRNYYLEMDLRKLLKMISEKSDNFLEIKKIIHKLQKLKLQPDDPLNIIIQKAQRYVEER